MYSEFYQTSKMERSAIFFRKTLHLRYLTSFWILLCLDKCSHGLGPPLRKCLRYRRKLFSRLLRYVCRFQNFFLTYSIKMFWLCLLIYCLFDGGIASNMPLRRPSFTHMTYVCLPVPGDEIKKAFMREELWERERYD